MLGIFVIPAYSESNFQSEFIADRTTVSSANDNEPIPTEYIIVLKQYVSIANATNILKKYQVQVIRNLKKNRYLIVLKNDPGIEQLQKDIGDSEHIQHIQPNFTFTIQ